MVSYTILCWGICRRLESKTKPQWPNLWSRHPVWPITWNVSAKTFIQFRSWACIHLSGFNFQWETLGLMSKKSVTLTIPLKNLCVFYLLLFKVLWKRFCVPFVYLNLLQCGLDVIFISHISHSARDLPQISPFALQFSMSEYKLNGKFH